MISKGTFLFLFLCCLNNLLIGQEDLPSVALFANNTNRVHPFYEILIKKDKKYINWLYFHCKGLKDKNTLKTPKNKPLIFIIKQENTLVKDTISNCINPKLYESEREPEWQSEIPLYGSLAKYISFHLTNDPKTGTTIDLSIDRESSHTKIYVLTEEGDFVSQIIDKSLKQGSHKLYWSNTDIKSGNYLLFTEIDTHLIIHPIAIEKNWWANLFSRNKDVSSTKKITTYSFELLNMPTIKRETHYIHTNRHGTSFGVNLLADSMVKIKLFAINGDYITTLNNKQLSTGESEFSLNKYIDKTGWYLIQLSINNKIKHIKLKIKK